MHLRSLLVDLTFIIAIAPLPLLVDVVVIPTALFLASARTTF